MTASHMLPGLSNAPRPRLTPPQYPLSSNLLPQRSHSLSVPPHSHSTQIGPPTPLFLHQSPRIPPLTISFPPLLHRPLLLRPNDHLPPLRTRYKPNHHSRNLLHHQYRSPANARGHIRNPSDVARSSHHEENRAHANRSVGYQLASRLCRGWYQSILALIIQLCSRNGLGNRRHSK